MSGASDLDTDSPTIPYSSRTPMPPRSRTAEPAGPPGELRARKRGGDRRAAGVAAAHEEHQPPRGRYRTPPPDEVAQLRVAQGGDGEEDEDGRNEHVGGRRSDPGKPGQDVRRGQD